MVGKIGLYKEKTYKSFQWRVRWFGEYDLKTGKEKRYGKTFALKKDAEHFIETKKAEFKAGTKRDPSKETLKDYAERWLQRKTQNERIRPGTATLYKETLKRLFDYFGIDRLLRKIDRNDAQDFLSSLKPLNKRIEPLSDWSKHRVLRQCKTLFSEVVKDGIVSVNPFTDCKMKSGTPSEWYYLKPNEFHKLLDVTRSLREKVLYALAYTAGLRESEILALYWADIDFEKGRLRIVNRAAMEKYPPPFYVKDTDTRTVPLPNLTLALLTQLQLESPEKIPFVVMDEKGCQRIVNKWQKCREQGKDWLNRYWKNNVIRESHCRVKQAGIDSIGKKLTVHILRKCCLQNWSNVLPMNVVKSFAGHSDISTTEKFYSTVDEIHFDAVVKQTGLFMTFSGVSKEKQEAEKC